MAQIEAKRDGDAQVRGSGGLWDSEAVYDTGISGCANGDNCSLCRYDSTGMFVFLGIF